VPKFDMFLAIQDRAFNDDGSINFANGGGQIQPVPALAVGQTPVTPGATRTTDPHAQPRVARARETKRN